MYKTGAMPVDTHAPLGRCGLPVALETRPPYGLAVSRDDGLDERRA